MPNNAPIYCPRCGNVHAVGQCPLRRAAVRPRDTRPTSTQRGYDYDWIQFRNKWFDSHPNATCSDGCGAHVNKHNADLDHIIPIKGLDDPLRLNVSNVQPFIHAHHSRKTRRQSARPRGAGGVKSLGASGM